MNIPWNFLVMIRLQSPSFSMVLSVCGRIISVYGCSHSVHCNSNSVLRDSLWFWCLGLPCCHLFCCSPQLQMVPSFWIILYKSSTVSCCQLYLLIIVTWAWYFQCSVQNIKWLKVIGYGTVMWRHIKNSKILSKGKKDKKYRGLYILLVRKNVQIFHDLTFIAQNIRHGCMKVICLNHIKAILLCKAFGESLEFFIKTNLYRSPAVIFVFF